MRLISEIKLPAKLENLDMLPISNSMRREQGFSDNKLPVIELAIEKHLSISANMPTMMER